MAVRTGILEERAEHVDRVEIGEGVAYDNAPAKRCGARLDQRDGLRMAGLIDEEGISLRLRLTLAERHGFGGGGRLVEQRGIGDVEAGQVADHRLKVQERFEAALADLRLIGRSEEHTSELQSLMRIS